jgi:class 3 adenylate cyclase/pimeloyl-ACP methyl ester carboxylesterase
VNCPRCRHATPPDADFCPECGSRLAIDCPRCGTVNAADHKFCTRCGQALSGAAAPAGPRFASPQAYTPKHLAEKILVSRASLEGERKQVTVLFVDVSGFTALSEKLDPEDVHQLMDQAFERMLTEVHGYEGTVNQFLGDGLMALFGAPIAHEDHPVRAVHAALGIQRALAAHRERLRVERSIEFQVRMGLNTGAVVVGSIGDNLRMDYTAVGDTTNVAARFLALAEPGQILLSEETARAVKPYFHLQPLGEVMVKGKARPVRAFRVEGARGVKSRIEAQVEQGLTPLVGREREVAILHDRFAEALGGRGQAVFVVGEAGIGKSRLLLEFRRHAVSAGGRWLLGRCVSYGRAISYMPILDLVRDFLELKEGDSVEATLEKIDTGVVRVGADLAWTAPFVRALLSLDPGDPEVRTMTPAHRRGRTAEALRELLIRQSQRAPLTLVIEDLHWIDPHSEEMLRLLLEGLATVPMLVLLTYRPGYAPPFGDQTYYTRITLHVLPGEQTAAMMEGVLQTPDIPRPVVDLVARRAEGNPLFIEELSKALVEDGTLARINGGFQLARNLDDVAIPDTIQGVIMARIDRLADTAKTALQVASVIGREFTARLVERVSAMERQAAPALGELRAVELIYEKATYPELAYMFKHALTHDVAYESLLKQRRRLLHRRAGEVIEELYGDRLAEFYETLAWHYLQGETWPKAADYLLKSALKARGQFNYGDATRLCAEAIDVLERHGGEKGDLAVALETLGDLESLQSRLEPANAAYEQALALADDPLRRRIASKRHRPSATTRDGARIAYYEHGSGEPTLLLYTPVVYGIGTFQSLLEMFCEEFRILTVDPRGHGGSDPVPVPYSLLQQVEDVRAVIEGAGSGPVVFIGISSGGIVGVHLAIAYGHLVEKLITIGTPVVSYAAPDFPGEVDREFLRRMQSFIAAEDYQAAWVLHNTQTCSEPGSRNLVEVRVRHGRSMPPEVFQNFFSHYRNPDVPGRDIRHLLPQLRVPTLVLHGEDDRSVPVEAGRYMACHVPGAQFYGFKGRGHLPTATATAELAGVVRNFVRAGRP